MMLRKHIFTAVLRKEIFEAVRERQVRIMLVIGLMFPLFFGWTFVNGQREGREAQAKAAAQSPQAAAGQVAPTTAAAPRTVIGAWSLAMSIGYGMLLAAMSAMTLALESFVGEKERNTIEILLSTPATDRELFQSKLASCLLISVTMGLLFGAVGTVSIYAMGKAYGLGTPLGVLAQTWGYSLAVLFVMSLTFASLGVIISSRVSSVKAGAQVFGITLWVVIILSMVVGALLRSYVARVKGVVTSLLHMPAWAIVVLVLVAVVLVNWGLLTLAIRAFSREKILTGQ